MKLKEFATKFAVGGHYSKDRKDWLRNQNAEVLAYVFGGTIERGYTESPCWALIFSGKRCLFSYVNGHRTENQKAYAFIKGFQQERYVNEEATKELLMELI
jgi:hypothetical protein